MGCILQLMQRKVSAPGCCRGGIINLDLLKYRFNNSLQQNDLELIQALRSGKTTALSQLYDRYGAVVYGLALKILKDAEEAEDLTQEVFVNLWHNNTYDSARGSLSNYLVLVTRSRSLDKLRSRGSRRKFLKRWRQTTTAQPFSLSASEQIDIWDTSQHVQAALAQLPERQRKILEMAYYQDLSQSEIAKTLNIPLGTVKTSARQALKKLREILSPLTK